MNRIELADSLSKLGWSDAQALQIASAVPLPEQLGPKGKPRFDNWSSQHGGHASPYAGWLHHELRNSGYVGVGKAMDKAEVALKDFGRVLGDSVFIGNMKP